MLEVMLGVAFASSLGLSLWLYRKMTALKNLQYRESLERVESQEAYENLLFSVEREKKRLLTRLKIYKLMWFISKRKTV